MQLGDPGRVSHGLHHDPIRILNDEHADDLLAVARTLGRHPDARFVRAERLDRNGVDLVFETQSGAADVRVPFSEPVADTDPRALRAAFADLASRARAALEGDSNGSSGS